MEKPNEQEEVEISQELYEELCIEAVKRDCTPEEVLEQAIVWILESAKS